MNSVDSFVLMMFENNVKAEDTKPISTLFENDVKAKDTFGSSIGLKVFLGLYIFARKQVLKFEISNFRKKKED